MNKMYDRARNAGGGRVDVLRACARRRARRALACTDEAGQAPTRCWVLALRWGRGPCRRRARRKDRKERPADAVPAARHDRQVPAVGKPGLWRIECARRNARPTAAEKPRAVDDRNNQPTTWNDHDYHARDGWACTAFLSSKFVGKLNVRFLQLTFRQRTNGAV